MAEEIDLLKILADLEVKNPEQIVQQIQGIFKRLSVKLAVNLDRKSVSLLSRQLQVASGRTNVLNQAFYALSKSAMEADGSLSKLNASLANFNKISKQTVDTAKQRVATQKEEVSRGQELGNVWTQLGHQTALTTKRYLGFLIAARGLFGGIRQVTAAIKEAIQFNKELSSVKVLAIDPKDLGDAIKVKQNADEIANLSKEIFDLGKTYAANSKELLKGAETLAQTGKSAKEITTIIRSLGKVSVLPTLGSVDETIDGLISVYNQFGIETEKTEEIIKSFFGISAKYAVEVEDLFNVVKRAGSVYKSLASDVQDPMDSLLELAAITSIVRERTRQSSETIGTALKTIFTRLQRPKIIEYLKEFNIQLIENGRHVTGLESLRRIQAQLDRYPTNSPKFAQIIEQISGTRQIDKIIPLVKEAASATKILTSATEGQALADNAVKERLKELGIQITNVGNVYRQFIQELVNDTGFQLAAKAVLELARAFGELLRVIRVAIPLLVTIGTLKFATGAFKDVLTGVNPNLKGAGGLGKFFGVERTGQLLKDLGKSGIEKVIDLTNYRKKGIQFNLLGLNTGGKVPALLTPGEIVFTPEQVQKIGLKNLQKLNSKPFAKGGFVVPGVGNKDTYPMNLEVGSFVLKKSAAKNFGFASGGSIGESSQLPLLFKELNIAGNTAAQKAIKDFVDTFTTAGVALERTIEQLRNTFSSSRSIDEALNVIKSKTSSLIPRIRSVDPYGEIPGIVGAINRPSRKLTAGQLIGNVPGAVSSISPKLKDIDVVDDFVQQDVENITKDAEKFLQQERATRVAKERIAAGKAARRQAIISARQRISAGSVGPNSVSFNTFENIPINLPQASLYSNPQGIIDVGRVSNSAYRSASALPTDVFRGRQRQRLLSQFVSGAKSLGARDEAIGASISKVRELTNNFQSARQSFVLLKKEFDTITKYTDEFGSLGEKSRFLSQFVSTAKSVTGLGDADIGAAIARARAASGNNFRSPSQTQELLQQELNSLRETARVALNDQTRASRYATFSADTFNPLEITAQQQKELETLRLSTKLNNQTRASQYSIVTEDTYTPGLTAQNRVAIEKETQRLAQQSQVRKIGLDFGRRAPLLSPNQYRASVAYVKKQSLGGTVEELRANAEAELRRLRAGQVRGPGRVLERLTERTAAGARTDLSKRLQQSLRPLLKEFETTAKLFGANNETIKKEIRYAIASSNNLGQVRTSFIRSLEKLSPAFDRTLYRNLLTTTAINKTTTIDVAGTQFAKAFLGTRTGRAFNPNIEDFSFAKVGKKGYLDQVRRNSEFLIGEQTYFQKKFGIEPTARSFSVNQATGVIKIGELGKLEKILSSVGSRLGSTIKRGAIPALIATDFLVRPNLDEKGTAATALDSINAGLTASVVAGLAKTATVGKIAPILPKLVAGLGGATGVGLAVGGIVAAKTLVDNAEEKRQEILDIRNKRALESLNVPNQIENVKAANLKELLNIEGERNKFPSKIGNFIKGTDRRRNTSSKAELIKINNESILADELSAINEQKYGKFLGTGATIFQGITSELFGGYGTGVKTSEDGTRIEVSGREKRANDIRLQAQNIRAKNVETFVEQFKGNAQKTIEKFNKQFVDSGIDPTDLTAVGKFVDTFAKENKTDISTLGLVTGLQRNKNLGKPIDDLAGLSKNSNIQGIRFLKEQFDNLLSSGIFERQKTTDLIQNFNLFDNVLQSLDNSFSDITRSIGIFDNEVGIAAQNISGAYQVNAGTFSSEQLNSSTFLGLPSINELRNLRVGLPTIIAENLVKGFGLTQPSAIGERTLRGLKETNTPIAQTIRSLPTFAQKTLRKEIERAAAGESVDFSKVGADIEQAIGKIADIIQSQNDSLAKAFNERNKLELTAIQDLGKIIDQTAEARAYVANLGTADPSKVFQNTINQIKTSRDQRLQVLGANGNVIGLQNRQRSLLEEQINIQKEIQQNPADVELIKALDLNTRSLISNKEALDTVVQSNEKQISAIQNRIQQISQNKEQARGLLQGLGTKTPEEIAQINIGNQLAVQAINGRTNFRPEEFQAVLTSLSTLKQFATLNPDKFKQRTGLTIDDINKAEGDITRRRINAITDDPLLRDLAEFQATAPGKSPEEQLLITQFKQLTNENLSILTNQNKINFEQIDALGQKITAQADTFATQLEVALTQAENLDSLNRAIDKIANLENIPTDIKISVTWPDLNVNFSQDLQALDPYIKKLVNDAVQAGARQQLPGEVNGA